jgi:hypothetical protein
MPRFPYGAKATVEGTRSIDVLDWYRRGYFSRSVGFSWEWRTRGEKTAAILVESDRDSVTLKYRSHSYGTDWSDVAQRVPVVWTPCRFGGERPWFVCPAYSNGRYCGRHVAKLYDGGNTFACRHCYQLAYSSQQKSGYDRGLYRAQKIREGLGGSASMLDPFPDKPKHMHWRTYDRLRAQHDVGATHALAGITRFLDRLKLRL